MLRSGHIVSAATTVERALAALEAAEAKEWRLLVRGVGGSRLLRASARADRAIERWERARAVLAAQPQ